MSVKAAFERAGAYIGSVDERRSLIESNKKRHRECALALVIKPCGKRRV